MDFRTLKVLHDVDKFHDPVMKVRLEVSWKEFAKLPMHNAIEGLISFFDNLLTSLSAIIEFIVPNQIIPVFLDLHIQEMEKWLRLNRLENILAVSIRITDFCLRSLDK